MNKLEDINADAFRDALGESASAKAAKRLMIALAYADGVRVETLSERYGITARNRVLVARPLRTPVDQRCNRGRTSTGSPAEARRFPA